MRQYFSFGCLILRPHPTLSFLGMIATAMVSPCCDLAVGSHPVPGVCRLLKQTFPKIPRVAVLWEPDAHGEPTIETF